MVSDMVESLRSTQIALLIRNPFWASLGGGSGCEVQKIFLLGKIVWNKCWEHRFLVPDLVSSLPRVIVFLHRRPKAEVITGPTLWAAQ